MHANSGRRLQEIFRARAHQTWPRHRFLPNGPRGQRPSTGSTLRAEALQELLYELRVTLRAEALQELLYELLRYELSFCMEARVALRVTLRAVGIQ